MLVFWTVPLGKALAEPPSPGSRSKNFGPHCPWKVIYFEAGPYRDYVMNLVGLAKGLEDLGLIADGGLPIQENEDAEPLWEWLSQNAGGERLVFVKDGFYSAGWDDELLPAIKQEILKRIEAGEVDLILAFGTLASQLMATNEHSTPVLSITATDPVAAGISKTAEKSGLEHVHVQVEAGKIERQLALFYNLFHFETLGVPVDQTAEGQDTMGLATIKRTADQMGFEIVPCLAELELPSNDKSLDNLLGCLEVLSQKSQAVYLTVSNAMIESRMDSILAPLLAKRLPTFSQKGPSETRLGVLMSLAEDDFLNSGRFEAEIIRDILAGASPGSLNQIYLPPLTMALNFQTAMAIGWNPPFEVLAAVDEFYTSSAVKP
jgi:ABC-type uncharacterized transport system substrate-binding protein